MYVSYYSGILLIQLHYIWNADEILIYLNFLHKNFVRYKLLNKISKNLIVCFVWKPFKFWLFMAHCTVKLKWVESEVFSRPITGACIGLWTHKKEAMSGLSQYFIMSWQGGLDSCSPFTFTAAGVRVNRAECVAGWHSLQEGLYKILLFLLMLLNKDYFCIVFLIFFFRLGLARAIIFFFYTFN